MIIFLWCLQSCPLFYKTSSEVISSSFFTSEFAKE